MRIESTTTGKDNGVVELITLNPGSYVIKCAGAKGGAGGGDKSKPSCLGGFGATLEGTLRLKNQSELIILPGNPGTDNTRTSGDSTTGAGGGGTYIALVVESDYPGALLTSGFSNADCNNKYVIPLMVAAGGNGGRDYGYSGDGAVYHGVHTTHSSFKSGSYQGGSFANLTSSSINNGSNFIKGGAAATDYYTRHDTSFAGFGGGGSNKDDGEGGGGGGYYGGHTTLSACSYYDSEFITNFTGTTGTNEGFGWVEIEPDIPAGPYKKQGSYIINIPQLSSYTDLDYIIFNDTRITPDGTNVTSFISEIEGKWVEFEPGDKINIKNINNVKVKYELSTDNELNTPSIRNLHIDAVTKTNTRKIILVIDKYNKFHNANDSVTVSYNDAVGTLTGKDNVKVQSFEAEFTPINVMKKVPPNEIVNVTNNINPIINNIQFVGTLNGNVESIVTSELIGISYEITRINGINP